MPETSLPGDGLAYYLPEGHGLRAVLQGQLVTIAARPEDTSNQLETAVVHGGLHGRFPTHFHRRGHECLLVLDGAIDVVLDERGHRLTRGAFASIPPGTKHSYQMCENYTRVLTWTVGGAFSSMVRLLGTVTTLTGYPAGSDPALSAEAMARAEAEADIVFERGPAHPSAGSTSAAPPAGIAPYVLASGDGERLVAADQVFTFLAHGGNTAGRFIVLSTVGPPGEKIPNHFHEKHTETFFCLDGRMTMWIGGREVACAPGDFVHVPAGTVHAYRLDAPFTRFVGLLSPGIFEPFFRTLCDPYDEAIFPARPGPLRFDRVMQKLGELDLKLVDPPRRPPHA